MFLLNKDFLKGFKLDVGDLHRTTITLLLFFSLSLISLCMHDFPTFDHQTPLQYHREIEEEEREIREVFYFTLKFYQVQGRNLRERRFFTHTSEALDAWPPLHHSRQLLIFFLDHSIWAFFFISKRKIPTLVLT